MMFDTYKESPDFVQCFIDATIRHEGGYVNDPNDSGGETNYGITKAVADKFKSSWIDYAWNGNMVTMPLQFAQDVYAQEYFFSPRFNLVAEKSHLIAQELFDTGVNTGTSRPSKWLQQLLNVFNNQQTFYKDITVDGKIGPRTCAALQSFLNRRGKEGERVMYNALNIMQGSFYIDLATRREKDQKFVWGWINSRVDFK